MELLVNRLYGLTGEGISGIDSQGLLEFLQRLFQHPLRQVDASEIAMGKMVGLVPFGPNGSFEPRNGLFLPAQIDEVGSDVVVWVAEIGIDRDRFLAFLYGGFVASLEAVGPAQKRMSLRCGAAFNGGPVESDRLVQLPLHLAAVGLLEKLNRLFQAGLWVHVTFALFLSQA